MMTIIIFAIFGIVGGGLTTIPIVYIIHFILQIPNVDKNPENLGNGIGLVNTFIIIGIFQSFKLCYRLFYKGKYSVKIGFVGALFISTMTATASIYSTTQTELYISKKVFMLDISYLYNFLSYSILTLHPILFLVIFISCFISIWKTMPESIQNIVDFANIFGIIEKWD